MGEYDVLQRTSDGFFDANALLRQWNAKDGNANLAISKFLAQGRVKAFIEALAEEETLSAKKQVGVNQLVIQQRQKRDKSGLKEPDKVWMHPTLFIKFAMWLNPRFEVKVIKFVQDELIKFRTDCGDNYVSLTSALSSIQDIDYAEVARAMNLIVFNSHCRDIRNGATHEQLRELNDLQKKLAFAVNMGFIKNHATLISTMRRMWTDKYRKF